MNIKRDWVNCPICKEPDMRQETDSDGNKLIHCVNHACPSNDGVTTASIKPRMNIIKSWWKEYKLQAKANELGWAEFGNLWFTTRDEDINTPKFKRRVRRLTRLHRLASGKKAFKS